jgi:hypothetical protein
MSQFPSVKRNCDQSPVAGSIETARISNSPKRYGLVSAPDVRFVPLRDFWVCSMMCVARPNGTETIPRVLSAAVPPHRATRATGRIFRSAAGNLAREGLETAPAGETSAASRRVGFTPRAKSTRPTTSSVQLASGGAIRDIPELRADPALSSALWPTGRQQGFQELVRPAAEAAPRCHSGSRSSYRRYQTRPPQISVLSQLDASFVPLSSTGTPLASTSSRSATEPDAASPAVGVEQAFIR